MNIFGCGRNRKLESRWGGVGMVHRGEEARCVIDGCKFPCMRVKSRKGGETEKERERERESKDFYDQRLWC